MGHDCPFQAGIFLHVKSGNSFFPCIDPLFLDFTCFFGSRANFITFRPHTGENLAIVP